MNDYQEEIQKYKRLFTDLSASFKTLKTGFRNLQRKLNESEIIRKQQHNTILQLKQKIRELRKGKQP